MTVSHFPAVLAVGALIADEISTVPGMSLAEAYQKGMTKIFPGGAEANFAAACARQGAAVAFAGCVGDDKLGDNLILSLSKEGVDVRCVRRSAVLQTRCVGIEIAASGERRFANITTENCADLGLSIDPDVNWLEGLGRFGKHGPQYAVTFFHFGSLSQLQDPSRAAIARMFDLAIQNQILVSYDPNIRLALWPSEEECRSTVLNTLRLCHVVKLAEDELQFLTGSADTKAADKLRKEYGIEMLIITRGAQGAYVTTARWSLHVAAPLVNAVDTTGAGDAFHATVIAGLLPYVQHAPSRLWALDTIAKDQVERIITRACAVGALVCTRAGAMPMPTTAQIETFISVVNAQIA